MQPSVRHVEASIHLQSPNKVALTHGKKLRQCLTARSQVRPLMRRQPPGGLRTTGLRTKNQTILNLSSAKPLASLHQPSCHKHRQLPLTVYLGARFAQHLHHRHYVLLQRPCQAQCPAAQHAIGRPLTIRPNPYLVRIEPTTMRPSKTKLDSESVSRAPSATSSRRILSMTPSSNASQIATGQMNTRHSAAYLRSRSPSQFSRLNGASLNWCISRFTAPELSCGKDFSDQLATWEIQHCDTVKRLSSIRSLYSAPKRLFSLESAVKELRLQSSQLRCASEYPRTCHGAIGVHHGRERAKVLSLLHANNGTLGGSYPTLCSCCAHEPRTGEPCRDCKSH